MSAAIEPPVTAAEIQARHAAWTAKAQAAFDEINTRIATDVIGGFIEKVSRETLPSDQAR